MKKLLCLLTVLLLATSAVTAYATGVPANEIKVGYICVGDDNEGYTHVHVAGVDQMKAALGVTDAQVFYKWNTPETDASYEAALDLVDQGCDIIFANSFSFETYLTQAAQEYPDVQFCHATGVTALTSPLNNFHNYFAQIHEARYLSGVVAGMKLNQMIADGKITAETARMGYVGAKPYAEVISGYTAFFLGARSVCPTVTMDVKYTGEWIDMALEMEAAEALIASGCVLLSQHSNATGPATACEAQGVPCVGYNISMIPAAPTQALTSSTICWGEYITYAVDCVIKGEPIDRDWAKGLAARAVALTELNPVAIAPGTAEKLAEVEAKLIDGSLKVFDCSTFTVGGETLTSVTNADGMAGVEMVKDGYYHEGEYRGAPCFDFIIDGITVI